MYIYIYQSKYGRYMYVSIYTYICTHICVLTHKHLYTQAHIQHMRLRLPALHAPHSESLLSKSRQIGCGNMHKSLKKVKQNKSCRKCVEDSTGESHMTRMLSRRQRPGRLASQWHFVGVGECTFCLVIYIYIFA